MEQVASNMIFPCKYATSGCPITMFPKDKERHEDICEHRLYSCPIPLIGMVRCKWQGSMEQVMAHGLAHIVYELKKCKNISYSKECRCILEYPHSYGSSIHVQSCFDHHFLLVVKRTKKNDGRVQLVACVWLIGTPKQAENFTYRVELSGNEWEMTREAPTPSFFRKSFVSIISKSDCIVVLYENGTKPFVDDEVLKVALTILSSN